MAQRGPPPHVIDVEHEINCPADKFYDLMKNHLTQLPHVFPEIYKSAEVLEGDGKSLGTVRQWTYLIHDASDEILTVKEKLTAVDDANRSLTLSAIGGDLMKIHKQFDVKVTATAKGNGSLVKWHIIYERKNEDDPHPDPYLEIFNNITKKYDAHYHKE